MHRRNQDNTLLGSPFKIKPRSQYGMEISELVPNMALVADDWCMVRPMFSDNNNHSQGA